MLRAGVVQLTGHIACVRAFLVPGCLGGGRIPPDSVSGLLLLLRHCKPPNGAPLALPQVSALPLRHHKDDKYGKARPRDTTIPVVLPNLYSSSSA